MIAGIALLRGYRRRWLRGDLTAGVTVGLTEKIGPERLFPILPTAVQAYESWARQHPAGEERATGSDVADS